MNRQALHLVVFSFFLLFFSSKGVFAESCALGTLLVVNKSGDTLSLIDLASKQEITQVRTGEGPHEVMVSPQGDHALVSNYGSDTRPGHSLTLIDIATAKVLADIDIRPYTRPHGLAWLADGRHAVVTVENQQKVLLLDIDQRRIAHAYSINGKLPHMLALGADAQRVYVSDIYSEHAAVIDLAKNRVDVIKNVGVGAEGIAINDSTLWLTNRDSNKVIAFDLNEHRIVKQIPVDKLPTRVALSVDEKQLLVSSTGGGSVTLLDAQNGKRLGHWLLRKSFDIKRGRNMGGMFGFSPTPIGILFHPRARCFYVAASHAGYVAEINLQTGKTTAVMYAGKEPDGLAISLRPVLLEKDESINR